MSTKPSRLSKNIPLCHILSPVHREEISSSFARSLEECQFYSCNVRTAYAYHEIYHAKEREKIWINFKSLFPSLVDGFNKLQSPCEILIWPQNHSLLVFWLERKPKNMIQIRAEVWYCVLHSTLTDNQNYRMHTTCTCR